MIKTYEVQFTQQIDQVRPLLLSIAIHLKSRFTTDKDTIGVNIAALSIIGKQIAELEYNDFSGLFAARDTTDPFHE